MNRWKLVSSAALLAGVASAADPKSARDPPGAVFVDQPAGISARDRNTDRDATDTLRGGRTDVIVGKRAARRPAGPQIRPAQGRAAVQQGEEARTGFGETGSGAAAVTPSTPAVGDAGGNSESSPLGTDVGYGTGTEPKEPSR